MKMLITFCLLYTSLFLNAQPEIEWQKSVGGACIERTYSIEQTSDGGYITAGFSCTDFFDLVENHGGNDALVVKYSETGDVEWIKSYGGPSDEVARAILMTSDGGYIFCGNTRSNGGQVSGNNGENDVWIVKINSEGTLMWEKNFGGSLEDYSKAIIETNNNSFLIVGSTESTNGDVSMNHGGYDLWILEIDENGILISEKTFGGTNDDRGDAGCATENGFAVIGYSYSSDGIVSSNQGGADMWVSEFNSQGELLWEKSIGGTGNDIGSSIIQNLKGEFIIAGSSDSNDGDLSLNYGERDFIVAKLSGIGEIQWINSSGGSEYEYAYVVKNTNEGGYIAAGSVESNDGTVENLIGNPGFSDIWVIKLSDDGEEQWQKTYGGTGRESAFDLETISDGSYIFCGASNSSDVDLTVNNGYPFRDSWVAKLAPDPVKTNELDLSKGFTIYPNPSTDLVVLEFDSEIDRNAELVIYNSIGVRIKQHQISELHKIILSKNDLGKGSFVFNLVHDQMIIAVGEFIFL